MQRRGGIHYAWIIMVCCFFEIWVTVGLVNNAMGLFIVPITNEFGCARSSVTLCQTMLSLSGLVVSLAAAWIYRKFRLMTLLRASTVGIAACLILFTFAKSTTLMVILSFVMGACASCAGWIPVNMLLGNWFSKDRNTAFGIAGTGSNVGGALFSALTALLIGSLGWRGTYRSFAIAGSAIMVLINFVLIKEKPMEMGLTPYGGEAEQPHAQPEKGPGLKKTLRIAPFWLLLAMAMCLGMSSNVVNTTLTSHMVDMGMAQETASIAFTIYMVCLVPAKILLGRLFDRIGPVPTVLVGICGEAAGVALLLFARTMPVAAMAGACVSLGNGLSALAGPTLTREIYGTKDFGGISGLIAAASSVGSMLGVIVINLVRDSVGSYLPGYRVLIPVMILAGAGYTLAIQKGKKATRGMMEET